MTDQTISELQRSRRILLEEACLPATEAQHLLAFSRKLTAVCDDPDLLADVRRDSIQWPADLWALWTLGQLFHADTIIEIGSHKGGSMRWLAYCFKPTRIMCIDPLHGMSGSRDECLAAFRRNAAIAKSQHNIDVTLIEKNSEEAVVDIPNDYADLAYVDGYHGEDVVTWDLKLYWEKIRPGGILAGHDYCEFHPDHFGVVRAVNKWKHEPQTVLLAPSRVYFARKPLS